MNDKEFRAQYKKDFDTICASDELKSAVMNIKPQKTRRVITPLKATIGTAAAAIMIFAAVHDYSFRTDTSGVISETVVSTPLPNAEFVIVEKKKPTSADTPQNDVAATQMPTKAEVPAADKPKQTSVPVATQKPVEVSVTQAPSGAVVASEENLDNSGVAVLVEEEPTHSRSGGSTYALRTSAVWTVSEYYEYLGVDVSQKIAGSYTGAQSFEFELGSNGLPIDDTEVLNFITNSGASVRMTVSKQVPLFGSALSGTIEEAGSGYNAYKISNGVYYNIYVTNTTHDEVTSIINAL